MTEEQRPPPEGSNRGEPQFPSLFDGLAELESRARLRPIVPAQEPLEELERRLKTVVWAREEEQRLAGVDLDLEIRCREERQDAWEGWLVIAAAAVGVGGAAVATSVAAAATSGVSPSAIAVGAATVGGSGVAGQAARRVRKRRRANVGASHPKPSA